MSRLRRRKTEARIVAMVAAGLVAANAIVGISVAMALQSGEMEGAAIPSALSSPQMAAAAGAMVFALSGFASVLVMRLSTIREPVKE